MKRYGAQTGTIVYITTLNGRSRRGDNVLRTMRRTAKKRARQCARREIAREMLPIQRHEEIEFNKRYPWEDPVRIDTQFDDYEFDLLSSDSFDDIAEPLDDMYNELYAELDCYYEPMEYVR